ncbi:MAG: acyl-CoA dehydrogenase family protein, partial [Acetobacteraceae bacterium]|nr:acyl-CoA dehydrogenase family protein [Acetobacteraceae bacterium]
MSGADESLRGILIEQVDRLLKDSGGPDVLRAAERGEWPEALWTEAEALGLPLALVPEAMGGAGLGWEDAAAVWQALGRHGSALPLAQCMAAAALLGLAGVEPPAGFVALALPGEPVAWGRRAGHVVAVGEAGQVALHDGAGLEWRRAADPLSREPADRASTFGGAPLRAGRLPGAESARNAAALLH